MIKLIKGVAAFSLVTSLIFSSPVYADAALGNKVSIDAVSQMRKAGMTESDIKRIQQHNKDEIEFLKNGGLDKKYESDQRLIKLARQGSSLGTVKGIKPDHISGVSLLSNNLGTYGDILIAFNASSWGIDFGYPGHAGIVSNVSALTVESFPADGVQKHTNDWRGRTNVYALSVKGASSSNYANAASYAENQVGKSYNWWFINPWRDDAFYCSQLVWKAWKSQGIDVDYVTIDPIVTPIEIAKSGNTVIYYRA